MKCPVCKDIALVMADRQGIEIDYCPQCRGVWLDRGELDKIIERSAMAHGGGKSADPDHGQPQRGERYERHDPHYREHRGHDTHYKKKRGGLLGELFDFD